MNDAIGLILDDISDINHHSVNKNHTNDTYTCTQHSIQIGSIMVAEIEYAKCCKTLAVRYEMGMA